MCLLQRSMNVLLLAPIYRGMSPQLCETQLCLLYIRRAGGALTVDRPNRWSPKHRVGFSIAPLTEPAANRLRLIAGYTMRKLACDTGSLLASFSRATESATRLLQ